MIVECRNIFKNYSTGKLDVPVLKDVNFSMEEGEYVAIMGPSGSGKSTLMNIIGCLDQPTSGELLIDGQDVSKCSSNEMADVRLYKLGFVFQNFQLLAGQTALQNAQTGALSVYDILKYNTVVLTKDAVKKIEEVYA